MVARLKSHGLSESGGFENMSREGGHKSSFLSVWCALKVCHLEKSGGPASLNDAIHLQGTVVTYQGKRPDYILWV